MDVWIYSNSWDAGPWTLWDFRLFDGWNIAPKITIAAPPDGTTIDLTKNLFLPQFTATSSDPEDGDLCTSQAAVVWTSNIDGKLGTGCSTTFGFVHKGTHKITAKATDSDGLSSTAMVTVKVLLPTPSVTITQPTPNQQFYTGATTTLKGYAILPPSPNSIPCNKLTFTVSQIVGQNVVPGTTQSYPVYSSNPPYCETQVTFSALGTYQIKLTAVTDAGIQGSASINIQVVNQLANPAPVVTIIQPDNGHTFLYTTDVIPLQGSVNDLDGEPITSITWTGTYYLFYNGQLNPVTKTLATGTLSTSFSAFDYCSNSVFVASGGILWIRLTAFDPSGSNYKEIKINLSCIKPPS